MSNIRAPLAEFIGTFFLCFAGIAAILGGTQAVGSNIGLVGIALAHGLALSVAIAAFGGVSGGHLNPAVTAGMLATGRITAPSALTYVIAQLAGATTAALICRAVFPEAAVAQANLGIPLPGGPWVTTSTLLLMEFVMTFLLMIAVFGAAIDTRGQAVKIGALAIGLTVTFDILAGGPVTGASMNPARSFGPALVQGFWQWHWAYWVAPIAGAVVAALVYDRVILDRRVSS
jgi:MIP family channel proteins